jgi:2-oxoglutarate ferredoxin oxidoreductase subunit gamma
MRATKTDICEEIIIAGFGGQGIILAGKLLAQAAMLADFETTYMPSYGAEMRGGTANSMIIVADKPVASPTVTKPTSLIVMNKASANKFTARVKPDGLIVYNSSLIDGLGQVDGSIDVVAAPADDIAVELGNLKIANMVMVGAYLARRNLLTVEQAAQALPHVLAERYHKTLPINIEALHRGAALAKNTKG